MYHGQEGQDEFLDTKVFKGFTGGTFVDVGAHNGVTISNTLFFEQERGWTGLLIEPLPSVFRELQVNRPNAILENCAVSLEEGIVDFLEVEGYSEMTSGIIQYYNPKHRQRIETEVQQQGGSARTIDVPSMRLSSLLEKHGIRHVHYLSVDVEGAEFAVIKSIDFDRVKIDVIGFENNYREDGIVIVAYLASKGYRRLQTSGVDIFMIHKDAPWSV